MAKKIGLPLWNINGVFGSTIPYIRFAESFGEVIPLMPQHELRTDLDLLILPGGADVNPERYNQRPNYYTQKPDVFKEYFDKHYLPKYIKAGIPIAGICRGMQTIFVHMGGSLIQHMYHETNDMEIDGGTRLVHKVQVFNHPANKKFIGKSLGVNSRHHQMIFSGDVSKAGFEKLATHKQQTSHIEAIIHRKLPIVAFQFHPEDIDNNDTNEWVNMLILDIMNKKHA